jgi:hypothetical protein
MHFYRELATYKNQMFRISMCSTDRETEKIKHPTMNVFWKEKDGFIHKSVLVVVGRKG